MNAWSPRRIDLLGRLCCGLVVALLWAVVVVRGSHLIRARTAADRLDAHAEETWLHWASPPGLDARATLGLALPRLRPGEPVALILPRGSMAQRYWRVMGPYYLVRHDILGVYLAPAPALARGTALVVLKRDGGVDVQRVGERPRGAS